MLFSHQDMFLIGAAGGVLSKATTVVLASCVHTRTLFDWSCWWCVVQGHYCCGDVLFSPPGHVLFGTVGGGLSQATTVVISVLLSPPGHVLNGPAAGGLSKATTVVVVCCSYHQDTFCLGLLAVGCPKATTVLVVCCSHHQDISWLQLLLVVLAKVGRGTTCFGCVMFSPPGQFLIEVVGGRLSQGTTVVVVLFSPPAHVLSGVVGGGLSQGTTVVVVCCSHHQHMF